jgi:hypothetical protein
MCERTFLHSSACVLRSPCGEARRASLLAPLGRFADKPNLSVGFTASLPSGKPRTKTVISAARREQVFYTEERFADKPNLRPSGWLYPLRSTAWRISLAPLGKSPSYVVLASLRTKVKTVCFVSFIARSARLKSGARVARTKVKTFVFCEACSRERSHKDPRG